MYATQLSRVGVCRGNEQPTCDAERLPPARRKAHFPETQKAEPQKFRQLGCVYVTTFFGQSQRCGPMFAWVAVSLLGYWL